MMTRKRTSEPNAQPEEGKATFYFQWHFIERCNLRCAHCYQRNFDTRELGEAKLLEIAHILERTLQKWQLRGRISLTGGEPFMRPDLLLKLLNFFDNSDPFYWTGILTNGTLINEDIVARMSGLKKLREIQISIDGASAQAHDRIRGKGSFAKAAGALSLLKQGGFTVSLMFTLHRQNRQEVLPLIDWAGKMGVDYLTIERMVPTDRGDIDRFYLEPEDLRDVYEGIYRKKRQVEKESPLKIRVSRPLWGLIDPRMGGFCPAGFSSLAILHDGTVLPCRRLEVPLGDILRDGLFKIWYTSEVLWRLRNKGLLASKCRDCEWRSQCGGCRAVAYKVHGDFMGEDPQCWKEA